VPSAKATTGNPPTAKPSLPSTNANTPRPNPNRRASLSLKLNAHGTAHHTGTMSPSASANFFWFPSKVRNSVEAKFPFKFVRTHRSHFRFSENSITPNSTTTRSKVRLGRLIPRIRPPRGKHTNGLTSLLNANLLTLQKPRFKLGKRIPQIPHSHSLYDVDNICPHAPDCQLRNELRHPRQQQLLADD